MTKEELIKAGLDEDTINRISSGEIDETAVSQVLADDALTPPAGPLHPDDILAQTAEDSFPGMNEIAGKFIAINPSANIPFWGIRAREGMFLSINKPVLEIPSTITEQEYNQIRQAIRSGFIIFVEDMSYSPASNETPVIVDLTYSNTVADAFLIYDAKTMAIFESYVDGCKKPDVLRKLIELEKGRTRVNQDRIDIAMTRLTAIEQVTDHKPTE